MFPRSSRSRASTCARSASGSDRRRSRSSASPASSSSSSACCRSAKASRRRWPSVGDPRTIIVMRAGSDTEMTSGLSGDEARLIMDTPGIERTERGPVASPELFVIVGAPDEEGHERRERPAPRRLARSARRTARSEDRGRPDVHARHQRDRRRARRVAAVRRADGRSSVRAGARTTGRWSASSTRTATPRSRRSGPTPGCCSPPISAATATSRSTSACRARTASRRSRTR